jgi:metal-dependent amidase/aminoacylase/carboxypeptidase family protein
MGGDRFNILASTVTLTGTVRTLSDTWHARLPRMIREVAQGVARAHGGRVKLDYEILGRPVINEPRMTALARRVAVEVVGEKRVVDLDVPSMGGEDFSEYLHQAPGCFSYIGTGAGPQTRRPWHHPAFVLHEPSLLVGVNFYLALARHALTEISH